MKYTVYVKKDFHCASDIKIIADNEEIEMRNTTFSKLSTYYIYNDANVNLNQCMPGTFAVQHCDVHTDHTSYILVECTFAINSTAPGFVLIQDEHSQYTINTTLQRHEGDVSKGSVNITDLPAGEYRVTVYNENEDILPAYVIHELVKVVPLTDPIHSTTSAISSVIVTGTWYIYYLYLRPICYKWLNYRFTSKHQCHSYYHKPFTNMYVRVTRLCVLV